MGSQQFPINLSGILVAAMLIIAAMLNQPPLHSERPPAAKIRAEPSGPFQDIPARIWEDPLEAVARTQPEDRPAPIPSEPEDPPKPQNTPQGEQSAGPPTIIARYLRHLAPEGHRSRLLLMPVMVSGAPHPALREQRLRMRVAVLAGLAEGGFLPLRSDRIGNWTWTVGPSLPGKQPLRVDIPFEAMKRDRNGTRDLVLILWLNDEYLSQDLGRDGLALDSQTRRLGPLSALDELLARIGYPIQGQDRDTGFWSGRYLSTAVRLIGPASSDSLEPVYVELLGLNGGDCSQSYLHLDNAPNGREPPQFNGDRSKLSVWGDDPVNFKLISPHATAPEENLVGTNHVKNGPIRVGTGSAPKPEDPPCATLELHRTIATDDRMISALIEELRLRGIDPISARGHSSWLPGTLSSLQPSRLLTQSPAPDRTRDHIVLISEWDTKFGRTLPALFESQVRAGADPAMIEKDQPIPWVHRFSYVRGLDGDRPAPASGTNNARPDILSIASGREGGFKEPAVGANQYDYLRRLAEMITELDWTLKRDNRGSIKAFGILGNDYFDKLLILQALKERFPSHLYFTNDLDAGFLDAKVFRWTRNLVIASSMGLTLRRTFDGDPHQALQGNTPPFRHSIQTNLYLTVLRTIEGREAELSARSLTDPPLLFEVGYGRFFQLKGGPSATDADPIHPKPDGIGLGRFIVSHSINLALAGAAALALILLASPTLRRAPNGLAIGSVGSTWVWLESQAVLLVSLLYLFIGGGWLLWAIVQGIEPFAWFGGVSIWPSEIVRLLAGWVASLCLIYGWRRIREGDQKIAKGFDLPDPSRPPSRRQSFSAWYRGESMAEAPEAPADADRVEPTVAVDPPETTETSPTGTARRSGGPLTDRICRLFSRSGPTTPPEGPLTPATQIWLDYLPHATLRARLGRVVPMTLMFWLFSILLVYGFTDPITPHRGLDAYLFDTLAGLVLVGLPFIALLFAAVDEARLCRGLLRRLDDAPIDWPLNLERAGCELDPQSRRSVNFWVTTEFIAERTAPAAHVIHLPLLVILFLLLSLSTRFDNWNAPASVLGLIGLSVGIALISSSRLRRTARKIRQSVVDNLKEEVTGIEYASAPTQSEKLRRLLERIEAIHEGAYTKWYNEPVFRALAWVIGIGIWIITEYTKVGG